METIKISILGDVCPTSDYRQLWDDGSLFNAISEEIKGSDLAVVNLECPATKYCKPIMKCGPCLCAEPSDVALIKKAGFNLISLANNHIKDFQEKGVIDTINECKVNEIKYVGAGENCKEASRAQFFEAKGKTIGIISYAEKEFNTATETEAGANFFDVYESPEYVAECKKYCDFLIVLYHGGIEHYIYPSSVLQKKCRLLVRCGADVVLCQHSHCIGTYEYYQNGYILYGQGNGVYGYRAKNGKWNEGLLIQIELKDKFEVTPILLKATQNGTEIADGEITKKRLQNFHEQSKKIQDKEFLNQQWYKFCEENGALNRPLFYGKNRIYIKLNRMTKNKLFGFGTKKNREMVTMNLVRCDAWREVIVTLLENDVYGK